MTPPLAPLAKPPELTFSQHALCRLVERLLSEEEIRDLWNRGKFVTCGLWPKESHHLVFVPHLREYCLMILATKGLVITVMPLIWREASVAAQFKLEAYALALDPPSPLPPSPSLPPPPPAPAAVVPNQVAMIWASGRTPDMIYHNFGKWPGDTPHTSIIQEILARYAPREEPFVVVLSRRNGDHTATYNWPFTDELQTESPAPVLAGQLAS